MENFKLSSEQEDFIGLAGKGKNVLVDACIGSGKTTSIQKACSKLHGRILYLTYNRRLMEDAQAKIKNKNVVVATFHRFMGIYLSRYKCRASGASECVKKFLSVAPMIDRYSTVIVDEYQDLNSELANILQYIKENITFQYGNPPQFVIVGDMCQQIYDHSVFDVKPFIVDLMGGEGNYESVKFTQCFRLPAGHAADLGQTWGKSIVGLNTECKIYWIYDENEVLQIMKETKVSNLLCLGAKYGISKLLNRLEEEYPEEFNKNTVFASIRDNDSDFSLDTSKCAIFTTFDASKGLERDVCVVCNFTDEYWEARAKYDTPINILKNMFLVAASRGKKHIVFYTPMFGKTEFLNLEYLEHISGNEVVADMRPQYIQGAFDHKYSNHVDECFGKVVVEEIRKGSKDSIISIAKNDGLIDLSPCIGVYAQAVFFDNFDIDDLVAKHKKESTEIILPFYNRKEWSLARKILYLTALKTNQSRYNAQVSENYVSESNEEKLVNRLNTIFSGKEKVKVPCQIWIETDKGDKILKGRADVEKNDIIYELKFVSSVSKEHFLQCALYVVALEKPFGYLWNLQDNSLYKISVPDRNSFMRTVCTCVSKGKLKFNDFGIVKI